MASAKAASRACGLALSAGSARPSTVSRRTDGASPTSRRYHEEDGCRCMTELLSCPRVTRSTVLRQHKNEQRLIAADGHELVDVLQRMPQASVRVFLHRLPFLLVAVPIRIRVF